MADAEFRLRGPGYYDSRFTSMGFPGGWKNCGDMTGTGNLVLRATGNEPGKYYDFYYVTGEALDDKIDMTYYVDDADGFEHVHTITANEDRLQDVLIGLPEIDKLEEGKGMMMVVFGSNRIPVRLRSDVRSNNPQPSGNFSVLNQGSATVVNLWNSLGGPATISFFDVLGRMQYSCERRLLGTSESFRIELPALTAGRYVVEIRTDKERLINQFSVVH